MSITRFRGWISSTSSTQYMILHYSYTPTPPTCRIYTENWGILPQQTVSSWAPSIAKIWVWEISEHWKLKKSLNSDWPNPFLLLSVHTSLFYIFMGGSSNRNFKLEIVNWLLNHLGNVIQQTGWLGQYIFNKLKKVYQKVLSNHQILGAGRHVHSVLISFFAKCFPFCFC